MRRLASTGVLCALGLGSFALIGCSGGDLPKDGISPGETSAAIIGGVLDNGAHPAVVAIIAQFQVGNQFGESECTGTIFKTDTTNDVGWVLSAAHCVLADPQEMIPAPTPSQMTIITGDNYATAPATAQHKVLDFAASPGASPPYYDLSVIKFSGVAGLPTLPLITADLDTDLADGQAVQIVGFGRTTTSASSMNSKKYSLDTMLGDVSEGGQVAYKGVDDLTIAINAGAMGQTICEGDSGGPWFRTINGQQYVIGVTSIGDTNCMQFGVGARLSPQLDFVNQYVSTGMATETCDQCQSSAESGVCNSTIQACGKNMDCYDLATLCGCAQTDNACINTCFNAHTAGNDLYNAILNCLCMPSACATQCSGPMDLCTELMGSGGSGGSGGAAGSGGSGGAAGEGTGGSGTAGAGGDNGGAGGTTAAGGTGTTAGSGGTMANGGTGSPFGAGGSTGGMVTSTGGSTVTTPVAGGSAGGPTTGIAGASGAPSMGSDDSAANGTSGSSGGCNVPAGGSTPAGAGLLMGLAALFVARKKRS